VHDDARYGGAGYRASDVATTTTHADAAHVAVHEIGHSLFGLDDEYASAPRTNGAPNCDRASCPRWKDMIGYKGVGCHPQSCGGASLSTAEPSLMRSLGYGFEEVNLRATCCTYRAATGSLPGYCAQFEQFASSRNWAKFCSERESPSGAAHSLEHLEAPEEIELEREPRTGEWQVTAVRPRAAGRYARSRVHGEGGGDVAVEVELANGGRRILSFSSTEPVEYPGAEDRMGGWVEAPRETISVLVDREKHGAPVAADGHRRRSLPRAESLPGG
jgi:hypothetical protein